jgi:hypothetical protein
MSPPQQDNTTANQPPHLDLSSFLALIMRKTASLHLDRDSTFALAIYQKPTEIEAMSRAQVIIEEGLNSPKLSIQQKRCYAEHLFGPWLALSSPDQGLISHHYPTLRL